MAEEGRHLRQVMRQRGAGLRNNNNADFDLEFGSGVPGSREERRLMRQRGAGNREITDVDFGFAFATPKTARSRRSRTRSKTPATLIRTPLREAGENRQLPIIPTRSTQSTGKVKTPSARSSHGPATQSQRKRRRLSEVSEITQATSLDIPLASELSNVDVGEDHPPYQASVNLGTIHEDEYQNSRFAVPSSPLFPMNDEVEATHSNIADKENEGAVPQPNKTVTRKRKRKSIGQQSLFKRKRSSGASTHIPTPEQVDEVQASGQYQTPTTESDVAMASERNFPSTSSPQQSILPPPPTTRSLNSEVLTTTKPYKRRRKRKSIVLGKKKRRSDASTASVEQSIIEDPHVQPGDGYVEMINSNHISDVEMVQPSSWHTNQARSRRETFTREHSEEAPVTNAQDDEDADETYLPDEATPEPTPAPRRIANDRPKKKGVHRSSDGSKISSTARQRKKSGFPILTHRMTNSHTLPTIVEESEPQQPVRNDDAGTSSADELSTIPPPPTITTRSAPNAADVLGQVCRETIDTSIKKLRDSQTNTRTSSSNTNVARQISALTTLRSTLDVRLFDLSQSLDQRLHLESRLRKSRREKNELQTRWLEVRKRRDLLALRMDGVRRRHWEAEETARRVWEVSWAAGKVEGAIGLEIEKQGAETRNEESMLEGDGQADLLEFSLRQISSEIGASHVMDEDFGSSGGGSSGILHVLKSFNAQLERAVNSVG